MIAKAGKTRGSRTALLLLKERMGSILLQYILNQILHKSILIYKHHLKGIQK